VQEVILEFADLPLNLHPFMHTPPGPTATATFEETQLPVWIKATMIDPSSMTKGAARYSIPIPGVIFFDFRPDFVLKALGYFFVRINA
jgi:hypothetical protein